MEITKTDLRGSIIKKNKMLAVFLSSIIIYFIAAIYNDSFINIMSSTSYLTWHTMFEFASIIVSFSIFTVTYFIYEEYKSVNMIIFGYAFLTMGCLDLFHTLSYKGMPDFFIVNATANRATVLWMLSRLLGSFGFMIAVFTPLDTKLKIKKEPLAVLTILFNFSLFLMVTYFPSFFQLCL